MFSICCTEKVFKKIHFPAEPLVVEPGTALGNWYVNILFIGHRQVLLFVSDHSRLAVITPSKDIRSLASHLNIYLSELLKSMGVRMDWIQAEISEMANARYSSTKSRSVLGTMNDFKIAISAMIEEEPDVDPIQISRFLSDYLVGPLQYRTPGEVAYDLLKAKYLTGQ